MSTISVSPLLDPCATRLMLLQITRIRENCWRSAKSVRTAPARDFTHGIQLLSSYTCEEITAEEFATQWKRTDVLQMGDDSMMDDLMKGMNSFG